LTADDMDDIVDIIAMTTFTAYGVHSQCMLGNLAQHRKLRSLSANQTGKSKLSWRPINYHRSRNWASKMHGKTKHSCSTINSEHQVRSRFPMQIWWPIKLISDQLWDLIGDHRNDRFSIAN